jgi:hypothetical protein
MKGHILISTTNRIQQTFRKNVSHKSTWLWIFETSLLGIIVHAQRSKEKAFKTRPKQMDCSQTYYWSWDLHVQLYHSACGRGEIYIFSFNSIVFFGPLCMLNGQKKKHFRLDQNKWIVWGFWTRKFTNPFFLEMWRRNALPTYIGKGPIYHKTLRKVWSGLAVQ